MKTEVIVSILGHIAIVISILMTGNYIASAINKNTINSVKRAYLEGIAAQPMPAPTTLNEGKEYVVRSYISSEDCVVSNIFPGLVLPHGD